MCSVYYSMYIAYIQPERIPKHLMNYPEEGTGSIGRPQLMLEESTHPPYSGMERI
jgi:hypothetical protein